MSIDRKILLLPGDGIGPEVILEAERVLESLTPITLEKLYKLAVEHDLVNL